MTDILECKDILHGARYVHVDEVLRELVVWKGGTIATVYDAHTLEAQTAFEFGNAYGEPLRDVDTVGAKILARMADRRTEVLDEQ